MTDAIAPQIVRGCPICGAAFTDCTYETSQAEPIEYDGGLISPVLDGVRVTDTPTPVVHALILAPCGCRVPVDEWQLCQTATDRWFARPGDVEATMRRALA